MNEYKNVFVVIFCIVLLGAAGVIFGVDRTGFMLTVFILLCIGYGIIRYQKSKNKYSLSFSKYFYYSYSAFLVVFYAFGARSFFTALFAVAVFSIIHMKQSYSDDMIDKYIDEQKGS